MDQKSNLVFDFDAIFSSGSPNPEAVIARVWRIFDGRCSPDFKRAASAAETRPPAMVDVQVYKFLEPESGLALFGAINENVAPLCLLPGEITDFCGINFQSIFDESVYLFLYEEQGDHWLAEVNQNKHGKREIQTFPLADDKVIWQPHPTCKLVVRKNNLR